MNFVWVWVCGYVCVCARVCVCVLHLGPFCYWIPFKRKAAASTFSSALPPMSFSGGAPPHLTDSCLKNLTTPIHLCSWNFFKWTEEGNSGFSCIPSGGLHILGYSIIPNTPPAPLLFTGTWHQSSFKPVWYRTLPGLSTFRTLNQKLSLCLFAKVHMSNIPKSIFSILYSDAAQD